MYIILGIYNMIYYKHSNNVLLLFFWNYPLSIKNVLSLIGIYINNH